MLKLSKPSEALYVSIVKNTYVYCIAMILVALVFASIAPYIFKFILGESFYAASDVIIYISIGFAFGGWYYAMTNYIFFAGKTKFISIITVASGVFNISLTSLTVVSRFAVKHKYTIETLIVGTRIAKPSNLPVNSGITNPIAAAAPVLVGIIDCVAERARLKS